MPEYNLPKSYGEARLRAMQRAEALADPSSKARTQRLEFTYEVKQDRVMVLHLGTEFVTFFADGRIRLVTRGATTFRASRVSTPVCRRRTSSENATVTWP